ncbi:MAG: 50S ribosomal protein L33 [Candidatus Omnitrophota bacterium]
MAKKKAATEIVTLQCSVCKRRNYSTRKNRKQNPDRMERSKYCRFDRKHTLHKEMK